MEKTKDILVFPETRESKKIFDSFISQGDLFIHFAEKNESGLKKLSEQNYDLIIVEINKPLISEISFIESLHSLEKDKPIVIVSEYFNDTKDILFGHSAYNYLSKPFTIDKLSDTVKEALYETKALKELHEEQAKIRASYENKKLSILYEISKNLHTINDIDKLINTMVDLAKDTLSAERATVFVLDKSTHELWSRTGTGINRCELRFHKSKGIAGKVAATGEAIITSDPYSHPEFNKTFDQLSGFKTRNLLSVPMMNLKGKVVGVFQVLNKIDGEFTEQDMSFLKAIASNASITLENVTLQEEKINKIEEMHLLYDELKNTQKDTILKTKQKTVEKIIDLFNEAKNSRAMKIALTKAKNLIEPDSEIDSQINKIGEVHDRMLNIIEDYLNKMINK
ncbi:MAG: GAF domain-containing protein [Bacteroidetes bacterium]|nr:GAF domain-containing protein [Bacteroidota bacterium]